MQTQAIRIHRHGDPEVMQLETVPLAAPAPGQVLLRQLAIGVNFIDTYHRSGLYPLPLPAGLGLEACAVVEAIGAGVREFRPGDRVAYAGGATGAYAQHRIMPEDRLVHVPIGIPDEIAAGTLLRGMTAQYLLKRTFPVQRGQTILVHAAAGGVGQILCQWARALGATVIGTAGSDAKQVLAGTWCDHVLDYRNTDWPGQARALSAGHGVAVVYDGVGAATFHGSLDCLAPRGMLVSFGNASGAVPAFDPLLLSQKGSLFFTRPTLGHYTASRQELVDTAGDYFHSIEHGFVQPVVQQRFALQDVAAAHRALESRQTTGSTILLPAAA
ncbi:quinone oxidoreductase family protein [Chitinilyticum piscinae]|uniref:Quinone oxidoreductase n=1 Tax=Chitinilyticum piscinae TaxID=2866724 RepID=A0A8J7FJF2_9NEIS|nr:quinone oxidoreductase [Chitinilyticum piscinae]MBE9607934.1 quinone oxidoreductase [Chitinilyticum piscinae]